MIFSPAERKKKRERNTSEREKEKGGLLSSMRWGCTEKKEAEKRSR
jgi:hypothetical protein